MALIKINGRLKFFDCSKLEVKKVSSNGRFKISVWYGCSIEENQPADHVFNVIGGRASGGTRNEWFCNYPEIYGDQWVLCNSMIAAINAGVNV